MNEAKLITLLNTNENYNFVAMDDKFSRYDAFDTENGIMLEIKCRNKHYPDTIIEKIKYDWNKKFAEKNNFEFGRLRFEVCIDPIDLSYRLIYGYKNFKSITPQIQNGFSRRFLELSG